MAARRLSQAGYTTGLLFARVFRKAMWLRVLAPLTIVAAVLLTLTSGCGPSTSPGGKPGEMVYYGIGGDIKGFDPVRASDVESALALCKIYEGLLEYDYLRRPYRVIPNLAEALPEISPDGLTYTFRIKKGIYFQDDPCFPNGKGREVIAEDFIYAFKRLMDAKLYTTGSWLFAEHVLGVDEWAKASEDPTKPTDYSRPIPGFEAPDRYTLRIRLRDPYPQLLWTLTMQYTFATAREAVEYYKDDFLNHPVGTGPYRLKNWRRNYRMEFERNPTYHEARYPSEGEPGDREKGLLNDAGKRLPFIDRIILYDAREYYTWWQMFLSGQIYSVAISKDYFSTVVMPNMELTPDMANRRILLRKEPQMDVYYIGFNWEDTVVGGGKTPDEVVRHRKLRQAITCSFNQQQIAEAYPGRIPASGPITPGTTGYDPNKKYRWSYNPQLARKLLAEAGYPNGKDARTGKRLTLTLDMGGAGDAETRQLGEMYVNFLQAIGVELKLNFSLQPEFWRKLERKEIQMFTSGWVMDYPDAQNVLQIWYGPNESPGVNHCNYKNPEFDKLYQSILTMQDSPERTAIYKQMEEMIVEDCSGAFLFHRMIYALLRDWVVNFKPHDFPYANLKYYKVLPH